MKQVNGLVFIRIFQGIVNGVSFTVRILKTSNSPSNHSFYLLGISLACFCTALSDYRHAELFALYPGAVPAIVTSNALLIAIFIFKCLKLDVQQQNKGIHIESGGGTGFDNGSTELEPLPPSIMEHETEADIHNFDLQVPSR